MGLIRSTLAVKGDSSALVIDGHVEGVIAEHEKHITVGKHGRVTGHVQAGSVTVQGRVIGSIRSDGIVSLADGADVEGDIVGARVLIAEGARLKGQVDGDSPGDGFVTLARGADVEGDIFCSRVHIDDGARFSGRIHTGHSLSTKGSNGTVPGEAQGSDPSSTAAA